MAKTKSRREQRQVTAKEQKQIPLNRPKKEEQPEEAALASSPLSIPIGPAPVVARKTATVDLGQEYFYVYQELKNIVFTAVIMFGVLLSLSYIL
jgi:hypothetical protein